MAQRILGMHSGALGDVLLLGRLLAQLPGEKTLLAGGEKARLLKGLGVVDHALDFDAMPMHELFLDSPLMSCRLPELLGQHDRLISCFGEGLGPPAMRLEACCMATQSALLPIRPPADFQGHLVQLWCDLLGMDYAALDLTAWPIPAAWRETARQTLVGMGLAPGDYILIHPGAGSPQKCWPLERFMELAQGLETTRPHAKTLFVLGPAELDRWANATIRRLEEHFPCSTGPTLEELAGLMGQARCFVGNDSGAAHLAAAVGTPTVALFGPTSWRQFQPLGRCARVLSAPAMADLAVEQVLDTCREITSR